jgi:biopolymer transport protein ExbD
MSRKTTFVVILFAVAGDLLSQRPPLQQGVSVQMPIAQRASEMRAADEPSATTITVTAGGKIFLGSAQTQPSALRSLKTDTIYVKADARTPYQQLLAVLDALHGKTIVLLSASPASAAQQGYLPPFGTALTIAR